MSTHGLMIHLGKTFDDATIVIDGQDVMHAVQAIEIRAEGGALMTAKLAMFASKIEALNLPADITIQPIELVTDARCIEQLVDAGYFVHYPEKGERCIVVAQGAEPDEAWRTPDE